MDVVQHFAARFERTREEELSLEEYLAECKRNPVAYATAAERMLKAIGATNGQISAIFLAQSAFVGLMGVAAGYGLGILAVHYRNEFLRFMRGATGWQLFPAEIYGFGELPALIIPEDVLIICGGALLICLLGGVIPAWQAGRLKPVEALRHE